jgi:hypothetical protein
MHSTLLLTLGALAAFVLYKVVSSISTSYRHAAAAKRLGCKSVPTFPSPDPLGIINIIRLIQSNNAGRLCAFFKDRFDTVSLQEGRTALTYQAHLARNWLFFTCDPKNIQALLATQFKDFELGPVRAGTFGPL